jgi:hypothetical protein
VVQSNSDSSKFDHKRDSYWYLDYSVWDADGTRRIRVFGHCCSCRAIPHPVPEKKRGQISFDERDQLIHKRATLAAYSIFWFFFTAACMIPWWILETGARIRVVLLPCMLVVGFIIVQLVQSVAILVQYGWRNKGEKS